MLRKAKKKIKYKLKYICFFYKRYIFGDKSPWKYIWVLVVLGSNIIAGFFIFTAATDFTRRWYTHCPKRNPNFRDIIRNVKQNEILYSVLYTNIPRSISCSPQHFVLYLVKLITFGQSCTLCNVQPPILPSEGQKRSLFYTVKISGWRGKSFLKIKMQKHWEM